MEGAPGYRSGNETLGGVQHPGPVLGRVRRLAVAKDGAHPVAVGVVREDDRPASERLGVLRRQSPALGHARDVVPAAEVIEVVAEVAYELLSLALIEGLGSTVLVASAAVTGGLLGWSIVGLRPRPGARPDRAVVGPLLVTIAFAALIGGLWAGGTPGVLTVIAGAALSGVGMGAAYPLLSSEPFESDAAASTVGTLIAFAETAATAWAALLAGGAYSVLHTQGWTPTQALIVVFAGLAAIGVAAVACAATRRGRSTAAG